MQVRIKGFQFDISRCLLPQAFLRYQALRKKKGRNGAEEAEKDLLELQGLREYLQQVRAQIGTELRKRRKRG